MKRLFLIFMAFIFINSYAQVRYSICTSIEGGRYEIIQSPISHKLLFKLDKEKGRVYQYTNDSNGDDNWEEIMIKGHVPESASNLPGKIKYQLFMSAHPVNDVFLLNIVDGTTYSLMKDSDTEKLYFDKIVEPIGNKMHLK